MNLSDHIERAGALRLDTRTRLTGLVSLDLLWRVPQLTPGDGAGVDAAIAVLSLALGVRDVPLLEELTTWLLVAYAGAVVAPSAYPNKLGLPADGTAFRALFGVLTVVATAAFRFLFDTTAARTVVGGVVLLFACGTVFLLLLHSQYRWTLSPEDERFLTLIDSFFPGQSAEEELQADFARRGVVGFVGATLARAAAGVLVAFPILLAGVLTMILLDLYPLVDLLVLAWVGLWGLMSVTGHQSQPSASTANLEIRLYESIEESTRSLEGMVLGIYLVATAVGFGFLSTVGLGIAAGIDVSLTTLRDDFLTAWGLFGVVLVPIVTGCYGLWCCLRMTTRLPAYLRRHTAENSDERNPVEPPRRPVGFTGPPLLVIVAFAGVLVLAPPPSISFALVWPLLILLLVVCLLLTRRIGARSLHRDKSVVVASLAAFVVGTHLLGNADTAVAAVRAGEFVPEQLPHSVYAAGIVVWLSYLPDAFRRAENSDGPERFLKSVYLLMFSFVFGAVALVTGVRYQGAFVLVLALALVGGISLFLTAWFRV